MDPRLQRILDETEETGSISADDIDTGLAVDMGQKAFEECIEAIQRNAGLTNNIVEASIVAMVAVAAISRWAKDARDKAISEAGGDRMFENTWAMIEMVFASGGTGEVQ